MEIPIIKRISDAISIFEDPKLSDGFKTILFLLSFPYLSQKIYKVKKTYFVF